MAAAVVRYATITVRGREEHLVFEHIRGKRPAVAENHRLPRTPVIVINLRAIFGRERTHGAFSFGWVEGSRRVRLLYALRSPDMDQGTFSTIISQTSRPLPSSTALAV